MIEQLISSYENRLCKQELTLVKSLYSASDDIKAAELLAERLASKGYGLALKRASPIDVRAVNTELIKYAIASRTDRSINQINSLHTGWLKYPDENGATYYFDLNDRKMLTGWHIIVGNTYWFSETGVMATGDIIIDGIIYQFGADGIYYGITKA